MCFVVAFKTTYQYPEKRLDFIGAFLVFISIKITFASQQQKTMQDYSKLEQCLNKFRELFTKHLVPTSQISSNKAFLKTMADTPSSNWTVADAFKLYNIIRPFSTKLNMVGFKFDDVPKVKLSTKPAAISYVQPTTKMVGYDGNGFTVRFPSNREYFTALMAYKGAAFDYKEGCMRIPLDRGRELLNFALANEFTIGDRAFKVLHSVGNNLEQSYETEYIELNLPFLNGCKPFAFQTVGIDYLSKNKRAICADQQRLGKTIQSIGAVLRNKSFPCLVSCKKTLRKQWFDEWKKWTGKRTIILRKNNIDAVIKMLENNMIDVVVTNFDGVETFLIKEVIRAMAGDGDNEGKLESKAIPHDFVKCFKSIIIDEAHHLRNMKTMLFKCHKGVCDVINENKFCLTGTPIVKGPHDLAALLVLIDRIGMFGGYKNFIENFKGADRGLMEGKTLTPKLNTLNIKLRSTCFIRRERHQVKEELPEKFRDERKVELDNRAEYDHCMTNFYGYLRSIGKTHEEAEKSMRAEGLVQFGMLKMLSARGKINAVREWADECLSEGNKVMLVCWHNEIAQTLRDAFKEQNAVTICGKIDGRDMKDEEVEANKHRFNTDPECKVMIYTFSKGGEGHTMPGANKLAIVEPGWTAKDHNQAEDRAIVLGKTDDVDVYIFIGEDTVDQDILEVIKMREELAKQSTGGSEVIEVNVVSHLKQRQQERLERMKSA